MSDKPWLKSYDEGVPHSLEPYPDKTLVDMVKETAKERPDHTAFIFKGNKISYLEFDQLSNDFAQGLISLGVKKGDRVAILLPNCPQTMIAQFGAWKAGAIAAMMNPLYTVDELEELIKECGAEIVVVLTPFYKNLKSIQANCGLKKIIATNIKEFLPPLLRVLFTLAKEKKEGHRITLSDDDIWFKDLLQKHQNTGRPDVIIEPDDPALLLFTGGTTGTPKGAIGTHRGIFIAACQLDAWFGEVLVEWQDPHVGTFPLFHVAGNVAIMGKCILGRHPLILIPNPREIDDLVKTVKKYKPGLLPGVPTIFNALLGHKDVQSGKVDFTSIKVCISGAAPLMAETKKRFDAVTGGSMVEGYALTESMMAGVFVPVNGKYKEGSVGLPLPDVDLRIVDVETGKSNKPTGEVGEILIKAKQLMQGYWNQPEETAETIIDGWLYTGDMGYLDEDGYLFIVDRKKDLIKPSGFQVWPREVEEAIASHPAVVEVGVAGIPDEYQGESVKAWIVIRENQSVTKEDILNHCKDSLAKYKIPKYVEFRDTLPKTTVGKVLRRELAKENQA